MKSNYLFFSFIAVLLLTMTFPAFGLPVCALRVVTIGEEYEAFRYPTGHTEWPWILDKYDVGATGHTPSSGPRKNHLLWTKQLGGRGGGNAVVCGGRAYVTTGGLYPASPVIDIEIPVSGGHPAGGAFIYAANAGAESYTYSLDAYTGEIIWTHKMGDPLECLSAFDGSVVWSFTAQELSDFAFEQTGIQQPPSQFNKVHGIGPFSGRYLYFGGAYGFCFAATKASIGQHGPGLFKHDTRIAGELIWATTSTVGSVLGQAAYWENKLYGVGLHPIGDFSNASIAAIDGETGQLQWETFTPGGMPLGQTTVADGKVYQCGDGYRNFWALDALTGKEEWNFKADGVTHFNMAYNVGIDGQARVWGGSFGEYLYCFDAKTGKKLYDLKTDGAPADIISDGDGHIYALTMGYESFNPPGHIYCLDEFTGKILWESFTSMEYRALSNGLSIADGILYAIDSGGWVFAFGQGPTTTEVSVSDGNVPFGTSILVFGEVYDESPASLGAPVSGVPVNIYYTFADAEDWTLGGTATADSMGRFSTEWTPRALGTYKVQAKFEGNDDYGWSSKTLVVHVGQEPPTMEEIAQVVLDELPTYTTADVIIATAVVISMCIGLYNTYIIRKHRRK